MYYLVIIIITFLGIGSLIILNKPKNNKSLLNDLISELSEEKAKNTTLQKDLQRELYEKAISNKLGNKILMFDVESTSLHGTAFAVGAVVMEKLPVYEYVVDYCSMSHWGSTTNILSESEYKRGLPDNAKLSEKRISYFKFEEVDYFELLSKEGAQKVNDWVKENVLPNLSDMPSCETDKELRDAFFDFYMKHKEAEVWSDCNFPVETNFLTAIVNDNLSEREFIMPYPLKDLSTIVDVSIDRCEECGVSGLKKHNPLDDSRASFAKLLKV